MHEFGSPDVLRYEDAPRPDPLEDDVLVRVHAAGVNPVDWWIRQGTQMVSMLPENPFPITLGMDVSGVVEGVGASVTEFETGDAVFGVNGFPELGSYAEYSATPAEHLAPKPESLNHEEAAGLPVVTQTAWQALFEYAECTADQRVLIHGAAGGVGHMAVQLAKWKGAHVIATASGYSEEYLRELGVDEFVNYHEERFESVIGDVDIVVDTVGGELPSRSVDVLKENGVLVSVVGQPSGALTTNHDIDVEVVTGRSNTPSLLTTISELIDAGAVRPTISAEFPLENAAHAHEVGETEHVQGKLVLSIA